MQTLRKLLNMFKPLQKYFLRLRMKKKILFALALIAALFLAVIFFSAEVMKQNSPKGGGCITSDNC